jgi:hypothetical protein
MILRLSQKLAQKIKVAPKVCVPLGPNPFADWSAHLFTADRAQYILLTNTASLYSMLMYGKGIFGDSEFIDAALTHMREFMPTDGNEFIFRKFIAPASGDVRFSKALNRSVTGSINDLVYHATMWMVERELSPFDAAFKLNDIPFSALDYRNPREVFKSLTVEQPLPGNEQEANREDERQEIP